MAYVRELSTRLGWFSEKYSERNLASITTTELEDWLRSLPVGAVSRNNYRRNLVGFFNHAMQRGWCPANPAVHVGIARENPAPIGILTPEQLSALLTNAGAETLPYWAMGAFAGLRSAELGRLEWKDVDFESGFIEITAQKSKTASRRLVKIEPVLAAWLEPYKARTGNVVPIGARNLLEADRQRAGLLKKWPRNGLRHSYASYHLARFQNAAVLALELGHTNSRVIFQHYRELVKPKEAAKYWKIYPSESSSLRALGSA